ncbi:polyhydroxyalkanoic acid system family protein [Phenylobacterium sp. LjRoot219]|uniref:polyhydroxyalkanoic acid system family protein n=1 Tax=Phenylobacterium sp. LjRoot219 TaxID=3342283 RepID=UPI003ECE9132
MSKAITMSIPHELGRAEARRRIDEGFASFSQHMGAVAGALSKTWSGDRLNFKFGALGQTISGTIDVEDAAIKLEVLLPGMLGMLANKVKGRLRKESQLLLEKK